MDTEKQGFFRDMQRLAEDYVKERLLLMKLQAAEKTAEMSAVLFGAAIISLFVFFIVALLTLLACYFLIDVTGNFYLGVGAVAIFYILLVVVLLLLRKKFPLQFVSNGVIKMLFKNDQHDDAV